MQAKQALLLPSSPAMWERWWARAGEETRGKLGRARFAIGARKLPLLSGEEPNGELVAKKGWAEFVHAVWMAIDEEAKQVLEGCDPKLTRADDDQRRLDHRQYGEFTDDPARSNLAQEKARDVRDTVEEQLMEEARLTWRQAQRVLAWHERELLRRVSVETQEYLARTVAFVLESNNPVIDCAGLMFAVGLGATNGFPTQTSFANYRGVTRQAVSKATKRAARKLGIPPQQWSCHMKNAETCAKLSEVQKRKHFRKRKFSIASLATVA